MVDVYKPLFLRCIAQWLEHGLGGSPAWIRGWLCCLLALDLGQAIPKGRGNLRTYFKGLL